VSWASTRPSVVTAQFCSVYIRCGSALAPSAAGVLSVLSLSVFVRERGREHLALARQRSMRRSDVVGETGLTRMLLEEYAPLFRLPPPTARLPVCRPSPTRRRGATSGGVRRSLEFLRLSIEEFDNTSEKAGCRSLLGGV
jgi:hypothetical protein